jgi:hypothetical protein
VELRCDVQQRLTLILIHEATRRAVFTDVALSVPPGGHLGFATRFNTITIDDVRLMPTSVP